MANEFSIQIHNFLTEKLQELSDKDKVQSKESDKLFVKGQIKEIYWLRGYLKENIDLKKFKYY